MLRIEYVYWLVGVFLLVAAAFDLRARQWSTAAFWSVIAIAFLAGESIQHANADGTRWPAQAMGIGVIALGLLSTRFAHVRALRANADAATHAATAGAHESAIARPPTAAPPTAAPPTSATDTALASRASSYRLFGPALAIPLVTLTLVLAAPHLHRNGAAMIDLTQPTLASLGIACVIALAAALATTRARLPEALGEGHRLLDALGCFAVLPMLLATLGSVFAATGVGEAIASLVGAVIPIDNRIACLAAFASGMVLFTITMGNAFAAFPVMMAGIGIPLLVQRHGADPAALGAIGMLTGYCGTLLTPMAANFNIVPAVLLELPDQYGVIRAQLPTALALLAVNAVLLLLAFR